MAKVVFTSIQQQYTNGTRETEVAARSYRALVLELRERFPELSGEMIAKHALAIDGVIIQTPLLEQFGEKSELVFVTRIAGG